MKTQDNGKRKNTPLHHQGLDDNGQKVMYWFTHGITRNLHHCSKNCRRPCEGHQKKATLQNKMRGITATVSAREWLLRNTSPNKLDKFTNYCETCTQKYRLNSTTNLTPLGKPNIVDTGATRHFLEEENLTIIFSAQFSSLIQNEPTQVSQYCY